VGRDCTLDLLANAPNTKKSTTSLASMIDAIQPELVDVLQIKHGMPLTVNVNAAKMCNVM